MKLQRLDNYGAPQEFWFDEARLVQHDPEAPAPAATAAGFGS